MLPHIRTGDGMRLARIYLQVIGNARLDQFLHKLHGVFKVDIVVARAMA